MVVVAIGVSTMSLVTKVVAGTRARGASFLPVDRVGAPVFSVNGQVDGDRLVVGVFFNVGSAPRRSSAVVGSRPWSVMSVTLRCVGGMVDKARPGVSFSSVVDSLVEGVLKVEDLSSASRYPVGSSGYGSERGRGGTLRWGRRCRPER